MVTGYSSPCFHRGFSSGVSTPWHAPHKLKFRPCQTRSCCIALFLARETGRVQRTSQLTHADKEREVTQSSPERPPQGGRAESLSCCPPRPPHSRLPQEAASFQGEGSLHPRTPEAVPKFPQAQEACTSNQGKWPGFGSQSHGHRPR